jgi:hypothetical protein
MYVSAAYLLFKYLGAESLRKSKFLLCCLYVCVYARVRACVSYAQCPRGLGHVSTVARWLELRVRIPLGSRIYLLRILCDTI